VPLLLLVGLVVLLLVVVRLVLVLLLHVDMLLLMRVRAVVGAIAVAIAAAATCRAIAAGRLLAVASRAMLCVLLWLVVAGPAARPTPISTHAVSAAAGILAAVRRRR
jgi:hypothetical protein